MLYEKKIVKAYRYYPMSFLQIHDGYPGLISGLRQSNERRRYNVTPSLIG